MVKVKNYGVSLILSFVIICILLCVTAGIFAYTSIQDRHLQLFVFGSILLSNLIGSLILGKKSKEKGILYGAFFGIMFCLILYIISVCAFNGFFVSNTLLIYLAICIISGMIGGVVGVNV